MKIEEKAIVLKLREMGIPTHIKGYIYLKKAIVIMSEKPFTNITKLYSLVANEFSAEYHATPTRVERAIRHAIQSTEKPVQNGQFIKQLTEDLNLGI